MVNLRVWCRTGYTTAAMTHFRCRRPILLLWRRTIVPNIRHTLLERGSK